MLEIAALVGKKIRQIRTHKHMSQEDLAYASNLHPAQVGHIERGQQAATLDTLSRLAAGLDVSLSVLVDYETDYVDTPGDETTLKEIERCVRRLPPTEQVELLGIIRTLVGWTVRREER